MTDNHGETRPKIRVAVVFGGRSSEHGVSCLTAREVMAALDHETYDVVPIGISRDGRWVLESSDPKALAAGDLPSVDGGRAEVVLASRALTVAEPGDVPRTFGEVDVVFPVLHGPWGEDGTIQGLFEMAGVRYVGSGVLASAVGMDKAVANTVFAASGFAQLPHAVIAPGDWGRDRAAVRESAASIGYPLFVKPSRAGSSMGGTLVRDASGLDAAIELASEHDPKVIVEAAAIGAREIECGVIQTFDGDAEASVVGEIKVDEASEHEFYDFEAKYLDGTSHNLIPADLPDALSEQVRESAVRAFKALGCEGLARVDFFLLPDGRLLLNEVNTMPGFTPFSMFPRLWAESGLDYAALVDRLIRLAMNRSDALR